MKKYLLFLAMAPFPLEALVVFLPLEVLAIDFDPAVYTVTTADSFTIANCTIPTNVVIFYSPINGDPIDNMPCNDTWVESFQTYFNLGGYGTYHAVEFTEQESGNYPGVLESPLFVSDRSFTVQSTGGGNLDVDTQNVAGQMANSFVENVKGAIAANIDAVIIIGIQILLVFVVWLAGRRMFK